MLSAALVALALLGTAQATDQRNITVATAVAQPPGSPSGYSECDNGCQNDQTRVVFASLFGVACLVVFTLAAYIFRNRRLCRNCGKRKAEFCSLGSDRGPQRCAQCRRQSDRRLRWSCADCEWRTVTETVALARRSVTVYGFPVDAMESGFLTATVTLASPADLSTQSSPTGAPPFDAPATVEPPTYEAPSTHTLNPLYDQTNDGAPQQELV